MLVVETSPNNTIITNPNPNWWRLTPSSKSVAANFPILYIYSIYRVSVKLLYSLTSYYIVLLYILLLQINILIQYLTVYIQYIYIQGVAAKFRLILTK